MNSGHEIMLTLRDLSTGRRTFARLEIVEEEGKDDAIVQRLAEPEVIGDAALVELILERIATLNPLRKKGRSHE
jgi:hypothetical protein